MKYRTDTVFFYIGMIMIIPFLLIGLWFARFGFSEYKELFACSIKEMCGLPCPGCGGTRALYYMFRGNFLESFRYHAAVVYGILAYLHFIGLYAYRRYAAHTWKNKEIQIQYYLYGAAAVILIQWAFKIIKILSFL